MLFKSLVLFRYTALAFSIKFFISSPIIAFYIFALFVSPVLITKGHTWQLANENLFLKVKSFYNAGSYSISFSSFVIARAFRVRRLLAPLSMMHIPL